MRQTDQPLELNKPRQGTLTVDELHTYRVVVTSGQYLYIVIDQQGIDVVAKLRAPDGQMLLEVDSPNGRYGPEPLSWVAENPGNYRIEVKSLEKKPVAGHYGIRLEALREPIPSDLSRMMAERDEAEAERRRSRGTAESRRQAIEKYEGALRRYQEIKDTRGEATVLSRIGNIYISLNDPQKALASYNLAVPIWRRISPRGEAQTLNYRGDVHFNLGKRPEALNDYTQSLTIWRDLGDQLRVAETLNNLGIVYDVIGEKRKALDHFSQSLPIMQEMGDIRGEASTLSAMGKTYSDLGEKQRALRLYNQALPLWRDLKLPAGEARTLNLLGALYVDSGEAQKALDAYNRALLLRRLAKDSRGEAITLNNIGRAYALLGTPRENYYHEAHRIYQTLKDVNGEAESLNYLGMHYWSLQEYKHALDYYNRALPLRQKVQDRTGEAATCNNIGLTYESLKELQKALEFYNRALNLRLQISDPAGEAATCNNIGIVYNILGERQKALDFYDRALRLSRTAGDRMREARVLYDIARLESAQGQLSQSRAKVERALDIVEPLRASLASPELRLTYRAKVQQYYELDIDLLMRLHKQQPRAGFSRAALQVSERARARSLLELLAESGTAFRAGIAPDLLERERDLQQQLNSRAGEQEKLLRDKPADNELRSANQKIKEITDHLQDVQAQIRQSSPQYAELMKPEPLGLVELQQQVLDRDTLLLEYALGEERSYLWAVTPTSITSHELPKRSEIEEAVMRHYAFLIEPTTLGLGAQEAPSRTSYTQHAAALSRMLLGPVSHLLGTKRLLVVADGALQQYLPFAALPDPTSVTAGRRSWQPLVVTHEIISLPSASTLAVLRRVNSNRRQPPKTVVILADPVYGSSDPRVNPVQAQGGPAKPIADVAGLQISTRVNETSRGDSLQRLHHTKDEAQGVLALLPEGEGKSILNFDASLAAAKSPELGQYRYVHFATHGWLDRERPELSALVFSTVDVHGTEQDGFLRLHDVYNLRLPAELVVLSACDTGRGKEFKGEGLVGLTRGFMYAGARRVVASLWGVNDKSTAELMTRFYRGMLKEGLRPAEALRAAQVSMWRERQWQAPYYWAAFVLQGEWR